MPAPGPTVTIDEIRAAIFADINLVVGPTAPGGQTAQTWDYYRDPKNEADFDSVFVWPAPPDPAARVHAWMVSLAGTNPYVTTDSTWRPGRGATQEFAVTTWIIWGYYGANDSQASEKAWALIVEAMINQMRADKKLGNIVIEGGPLNIIEGMGPDKMVMLANGEAGVLCHFAKGELLIRIKLEG